MEQAASHARRLLLNSPCCRAAVLVLASPFRVLLLSEAAYGLGRAGASLFHKLWFLPFARASGSFCRSRRQAFLSRGVQGLGGTAGCLGLSLLPATVLQRALQRAVGDVRRLGESSKQPPSESPCLHLSLELNTLCAVGASLCASLRAASRAVVLFLGFCMQNDGRVDVWSATDACSACDPLLARAIRATC